jgi:Flp pilus assembly protein TadG
MRYAKKSEGSIIHDEQGVTLVLIAILLAVFLAFVAMAVDIAHLYVVRNELHNAADAGALAGARCLYDCFTDGSKPGSKVNTLANQIAWDAAKANKSEKVEVEVKDALLNSDTGDVQRGHWSFTTRTFTRLTRTDAPALWNITTEELDNPTDPAHRYVNAVRVKTRRETTQASSFFARILGFVGFNVTAESVAYIGFAASLEPTEADQPIAICKQSITDANGNYTSCNTGRMSNSGSNAGTHNTAAWTNFTLDCTTANKGNVVPLVCSTGNKWQLPFGSSIGSTGGEIDPISTAVRTCFAPKTRTTSWEMTLPVIDCPSNNPGNCSKVIGAVSVNIVWVSDKDATSEKEFQNEDFPPSAMDDWTCTGCASSSTPRQCCWNNFVAHFKLENVDGATATYARRSIYFIPKCIPHEPTGDSGGQNFGILAKIPVLVN